MRVAEIRIYPVKGLRGVPLTEATVEPWGLVGDRRFMVTDPGGGFLTQRQYPCMAVIVAGLTATGLRLSAPGQDAIAVASPDPEGPSLSVTVWRNVVAARDCGDAAATWLSEAIGAPVRLVHMPDPERARPVDPDFSDAGDTVTFADGFPLLVTTLASLGDLETRLGRGVGMDRFRANLVVEGAEPWAEDGWRQLAVGGVRFEGRKDCARCAVTTVDQETGERSPETEPLRTLASFRRKAQGRIIFGMNLIPRAGGRIAIGDRVAAGA